MIWKKCGSFFAYRNGQTFEFSTKGELKMYACNTRDRKSFKFSFTH